MYVLHSNGSDDSDSAGEYMTDKSTRPSLDQVFMSIAQTIGTRATCRHRDQGAVIVKDKHIISTGYNGSPPGMPHCIDIGFCSKKQQSPCMAEGLHGESNAIITAARMGISTEGATIYSVYSPCRTCCNILKAAGIIEVIYHQVYSGFTDGPEYLKELGISCRII